MSIKHLIIAGVHKAGTTSLFTYLAFHKEICASEIKETHFFSSDKFEKKYNKYEDYFKPSKSSKFFLEASPEYIYEYASSIEKIKSLASPKLIFIFRDPVDKIVSSFNHRKTKLEFGPDYTFSRFQSEHLKINNLSEIDLSNRYQRELKDGCYINYLKNWFNNFDDKNIKIIFFDDLSHNPKSSVEEIMKWLELDSSVYTNYNFSIENKSVIPKNKVLQKIAISINKKLEPVLRKKHKLKKFLRSIYYKINISTTQNQDDSSKESLKKLYFDKNQELKKFLKKYGYKSFPSWMD